MSLAINASVKTRLSKCVCIEELVKHMHRMNDCKFIFVSLPPSLCSSTRPSRINCQLCKVYSSGWIISILGTHDHCHERVSCAITFGPDLSSRSFRHEFVIMITEICMSRMRCPLCNVYSSGWIISILHKNDTPMRGCVVCNDLWRWSKSSRLFNCDVAYLWIIFTCDTTQSMTGWCVTHHNQVNRSKVKVTPADLKFWSRSAGYRSRSVIYNF